VRAGSNLLVVITGLEVSTKSCWALPISNGMKQAHLYAQALRAAERDAGADDLVSGLMATLKRHGHMKLLPAIFRAYREEQMREKRQKTITLTTATLLSHEEGHVLARKYSAMVGERKVLRSAVDETLTKGFVLETNRMRMDTSAKRALTDLYQRLAGKNI